MADKNDQLNVFNRRMLAAIRASNPTRMVYITSNRWSAFTTIEDAEMPAAPHVAITLHYYEPMIFTHQRTPWSRLPENMPVLKFPGPIPDLTGFVPTDHYDYRPPGYELTVQAMNDAFDRVAAWAAKNAPGREIHLGEFGVYFAAADASQRNYIRAIMANTSRLGRAAGRSKIITKVLAFAMPPVTARRCWRRFSRRNKLVIRFSGRVVQPA